MQSGIHQPYKSQKPFVEQHLAQISVDHRQSRKHVGLALPVHGRHLRIAFVTLYDWSAFWVTKPMLSDKNGKCKHYMVCMDHAAVLQDVSSAAMVMLTCLHHIE